MINICFTRHEIARLSRLIESPDTYADALSLVTEMHSRADDKAIADDANDVFALEVLAAELEYQMRNPHAIDIDPLKDSIHDCLEILDAAKEDA